MLYAEKVCFRLNICISENLISYAGTMQVLSDLFRIYQTGCREIWNYERRLARYQTNMQMSSAK